MEYFLALDLKRSVNCYVRKFVGTRLFRYPVIFRFTALRIKFAEKMQKFAMKLFSTRIIQEHAQFKAYLPSSQRSNIYRRTY